jgi:hypothetical protein
VKLLQPDKFASRNQEEIEMSRRTVNFIVMTVLVGGSLNSAPAQQTPTHAQKLLTNDDVIAMVHKKLPESVIVSAIQAGPSKFNSSSNELIRLNAAGVTEKELNAILAASGNSARAEPAAAPKGTTTQSAEVMAASKSRMPRLTVTQGGSSQELKLEKTQLAETKTKPSSMKNLAADSAVTQAMQAGVNTVAYSAATHMNSGIGGSAMQQAGGIFSGVMSHRTATVTYVWGVLSPASGNVLHSSKPSFTLDFSRTIGVTPDDYEPAIVKLTPAQNTCRVVGATQGKADVRSSPAADWQMYSHFLEERVASSPQKLGPGKYKITGNSELAPGEYGIVLRPISKEKKFSGGDVARAQGDGLMFDAIWTFQISEDAE